MLFPVYFIFLTNCKKNIFFFWCWQFSPLFALYLWMIEILVCIYCTNTLWCWKCHCQMYCFLFGIFEFFGFCFFFLIKDTGVSWILTKKTQTYLNCHSLFCFLILENLYLWYFPLLAVEEYSNWKGIAVDSQALYLYFLLTLVWLLCF